MNIVFYYGKTFKDSSAALMEAIVKGSASPKTQKILLVPDKLTLSAETETLYAHSRGGTFNVYVYSFTRLCSVLARGAERGKYLNKQSSVELFARLIAENQSKLNCFSNQSNRVGFAESVYNTVSKLRYCLITPEMLRRYTGKGQLRAKVDDLALLYEKYNEYISDRFYDSSTKLDILCSLLDDPSCLKNTHIYLKDYDNFSLQELRIIKKMMASAASLSIACTYDREKPYLYKNEIFNSLKRLCDELGTTPVLIDANKPADPIVEHIKDNLFSFGRVDSLDCAGRVQLYAAADAYDEAEAAARYISNRVRRGARYKDFTVVAANLGSYRLPLVRAFAKYNVPCYLDEGTNLAEHVLGRYLMSLLHAKTEGLTLKSALPLVKNYFGASEDADEFENYCLRYGITGFSNSFETGKYATRANNARCVLINAVESLDLPAIARVEDFTSCIKVFLDKLDIKEGLARLAEEERRVGIEASARATEQVWDKLIEVLDAAETVLAGYHVTDKEFVRIIGSGLASVNISVVPMRLDCVYAGELTTSKYHAVNNLLVLGCIEGVIPGEGRDTDLLTENNIRELKTLAALNIEPGIASENAKNKFNVYQLMCEPRGEIYLSYPTAGTRGQRNKESRLFTDFSKMFDITEQEESFAETIFNRTQAEMLLTEGAAKTDRKLNALFYALGGEDKPDVPPEKINAVKLYRGKKGEISKFSCSKVEKFYRCPLMHFLTYGLKLKARILPDIKPVDTGVILHAAAQEFLTDPAAAKKDLTIVASELIDKELTREEYKKFRSAKNFSAIEKRLKEEAVSFFKSILCSISNSDFVPNRTALEYEFGTEENADFLGKIDRIDTTEKYVRIIDYKTGSVKATYSDIYAGLKLQLLIYLREAERLTGKIPSGAYYFPVRNDYDSKAGQRLVGFTLEDAEVLYSTDKHLVRGVMSREANIKITLNSKTKKESGSGDKILSAERMRTLLDYAKKMADAAKAEILKGNNAAAPFKGACDWCDFSPFCLGKDKTERTVPTMQKKDFEC